MIHNGENMMWVLRTHERSAMSLTGSQEKRLPSVFVMEQKFHKETAIDYNNENIKTAHPIPKS